MRGTVKEIETLVTKGKIDDKLIASSVAGDPRAREELAKVCFPKVWRTVYLSCGGGPDVEDLVQSSMAKAFEDLPSFGFRGDFGGWLRRVTVNVVRQHFRRRSVRSLIPFSHKLDLFTDQSQPNAEGSTEGDRFMERLAGHLAGLKEKNRMAVTLSITEGMTAAEIAPLVGCGFETAKKRLLRGRRALAGRVRKDPYMKQLLEEYGI